jgi:hypothetical protein
MSKGLTYAVRKAAMSGLSRYSAAKQLGISTTQLNRIAMREGIDFGRRESNWDVPYGDPEAMRAYYTGLKRGARYPGGRRAEG